MTTRAVNRFWLQRLCEAVFFLSFVTILCYAANRVPALAEFIPVGLSVHFAAAISAVVTGVIAIILHSVDFKHHTKHVAPVIYFIAVVFISILIQTSPSESFFTGLWPLTALFAGFFGGGMVLLLVVLLAGYLMIILLQHGLDISQTVGYALVGMIPILLGYILWRRQPEKKERSELRDLANHLSAIEGKSDVVINTIDDGVLAINPKGSIELINPAAQRLVGWNKGDALGLDWRSVLKLTTSDGKEVPDIDHPITQALSTNKPIHNDTLSLTTNGDKKRLISIIVSPVGRDNSGIIVVFRDITKEKREERQQAEFISTASHEMRTPVASIEGYLGLALNPNTAQIDERARDYITKAHESVQHLGELFQDLLDISKAEDGRLRTEPQVLDITAATSDIFANLAPLAQKKQLRYIFKPNPSLETESSSRNIQPVFYAYVDPGQLREVVSNLIENAIKYTPQGDVLVNVVGDERMISISVQDSGIGIPAEDIPHLFQKFYRVDNSDTREVGGTGLGLYLCRRLAEAMNGHLRVESTYKQGSTFFLDIPRISHEDAMNKLHKLTDVPPVIHKPVQAISPPQSP